ncbi:MAG TPA: molecular chaperone HtpG [Chloroflexota bacterium]|nr:molecular chaperone HtpG [Chloroflexota bacterium]
MSTEEQTTADAYHFKAEIKQVLHILVHSLYQDREIFLRELVSNASDAMTRMQFEMLTNHDVLDPDAELAVHIDVPEVAEDEPKKIIIRDSGIGMTKDELVQNLGTIAQSGAREFLTKVGEGETFDANDLIGQFGVGFYSVFMVAEEVRVVSRSYKKRAKAAAWVCDGSDAFRVEAAEKEDRGTEIHITLRSDAVEFANEWKLKQIVKKHSDFVRYPIYVGEGPEGQANQQTSLWRQRPSDIQPDAYRDFYRQMTMEFEEPLLTVHFATDVPVSVNALLFVPGKREPGILASRKEPGVMLYSHNVLIQEYCTDLLPAWLQFVDGVVDSEDLPLNVSRETVQNNRLMAQLGKTIRGRLLRDLKKMGQDDAAKYEQFWGEFGRAFKEAVAIDPAAKEEVLPLYRYQSSKSDGQLISLDEYVARMPETQEAIYFVLADTAVAAAHSPHLDPFKARDLEVLYWVDPLDALISPMLGEYKGKPFKNVDEADMELPDTAVAEADTDEPAAIAEPDLNRFIGVCVTTLGERVTEVRVSKVLKDSPVRLVSPKDAQNKEMHRIQRLLDREYEVPRKILEVNGRHPLIANLAQLASQQPDAPLLTMSIEQLYANALVQEGLHPNPADMLPRIQTILEVAAAQAVQ